MLGGFVKDEDSLDAAVYRELHEETGEMHKPTSGRPGKLFRFNQKKYKEVEAQGFHFEIKLA